MAAKMTAAESAARKRKMERHVRNATVEELGEFWERSGGPRVVVAEKTPGVRLPALSCAVDLDASVALCKGMVCAEVALAAFGETAKLPLPLEYRMSACGLVFEGSSLRGPIIVRQSVAGKYGPGDAERPNWSAPLAGALDALLASQSPLKELLSARIVTVSPINESAQLVQIEMVYPQALDSGYMVALLHENGLLTEDDLRGGEGWRTRPVDPDAFAGRLQELEEVVKVPPKPAEHPKAKGDGPVAADARGLVEPPRQPTAPAQRTRSQRGDVDLLITGTGYVVPAALQVETAPTSIAPKLDYKYDEETTAVWSGQPKAKAASKSVEIDPKALASIKAEEEKLGALKRDYENYSNEACALRQSLSDKREKRESVKRRIEGEVRAASESLPVRWNRLGAAFACVIGAIVCIFLGVAGILRTVMDFAMMVFLIVGAVYLIGFLLSIIQAIATGISAKNRVRKARHGGAFKLKDLDTQVDAAVRNLAAAEAKEATAKKAYEAQKEAVERARADAGLSAAPEDGDRA